MCSLVSVVSACRGGGAWWLNTCLFFWRDGLGVTTLLSLVLATMLSVELFVLGDRSDPAQSECRKLLLPTVGHTPHASYPRPLPSPRRQETSSGC